MAITVDQAALAPTAGSTGTGSANITQQNHTFNTSAAVASGAMIVILAHRFHTGGITGTITGTGGGLTWTTVHKSESGNIGIYLVAAFAPSGLASATSIGVNCSVNSNDYTITAASYLGVDSSGGIAGAIRAFNAGSGAGPGWASGSVTGTAGDALIGGAGGDGTISTSTPSAGVERDDFNSGTSSGSITLIDKLSVSGTDSLAGTWSNTLANVSVAAAFKPASTRNILLVVADSAAMTAVDTAHQNLLTGLGYTVTVRSDETAEDVTGMNGVVIAESCASATLGSKYATVAVPVVTFEPGNYVELGLGGEDGEDTGMTQMTVLNSAHPITRGPFGFYTGAETLFSTGHNYGVTTTPASGMIQIARGSTASRICLMACDAGATLNTGPAPAKRATAPNSDTGGDVATANGKALYKNIFVWAFGPSLSYSTEVMADGPLAYWTMNGSDTSPLDEQAGGTGITINGPTPVAAGLGPLDTSQDTGAWSFDGSNDFGQVAIDLSTQTTITVEFWLKWDNYANDDDLAMEYGTSNSTGGFVIDPNESATFNFEAYMPTGGGSSHGENVARSVLPVAQWHHVVIVFKRGSGTQDVDFIVNGIDVSENAHLTNNITGNFGNLTLNLMSRNGTSLFGAGDMAHLAVYSGALSLARAQAHYAARTQQADNTMKGATAGMFGEELVGTMWF